MDHDYKRSPHDEIALWWETRMKGFSRHDWVWVVAPVLALVIIGLTFPGWDIVFGVVITAGK